MLSKMGATKLGWSVYSDSIDQYPQGCDHYGKNDKQGSDDNDSKPGMNGIALMFSN